MDVHMLIVDREVYCNPALHAPYQVNPALCIGTRTMPSDRATYARAYVPTTCGKRLKKAIESA